MKSAWCVGLVVLAAVVGCSDARGVRGDRGALAAESDPEEATLVHAVRLHPRDAAAWARLGGFWTAKGRYEAAAGALDRALVHAPDDAEARLRLAVALYNLGRDDEARAQLALVAPKGADAHWLAANLALRAGDRSTAARECASAARLDRARYEVAALGFVARLVALK